MGLVPPDDPSSALSPEVVRLQVERILASEGFRNKDKLSRFLRFVVEATLAGEASAIKQHSVGEALGYQSTPDSDNIVRQHAHRLRQALTAYYAGAGVDDPIRIDLPKGGYVPVFSRNLVLAAKPLPSLPAAKPTGVFGRLRFRARVAFGLIAAAALAGGLFAWRWRQPAGVAQPRLSHLTVADASEDAPSASSDGSLIAYASDLAGNLDIYVQSFATHKAVRLTTHPADDYNPDISPDGTRVVFRSMRDGGGIYMVSTAGGPETRLATGFAPRFSPDGARVAYYAIEHSGQGGVYVIPSEGGEATRVSGNLVDARYPVWSPDGKRLLVRAAAAGSRGEDLGWWILTLNSTELPIRTGAASALSKLKPALVSYPYDWDGDHLLAASGRIAELTLNAKGTVNGPPRILYPGPAATAARYFRRAKTRGILFSNDHTFVNIFGLGIDPQSGALNGIREQWTNDETLIWREEAPITSLSADGRRLAYPSFRERNLNIWVKDIVLKKEWPVTGGPEEKIRPILNQAGTRVAFLSTRKGGSAIRVAEVETGQVRTICEDCGKLRHWSPDERHVLAVQGHRLLEIDAETGSRRAIIEGDAYEPQEAAYSPDGRWVALVVGIVGEPKLQGVILPAAGAARADWIPVTDEPYQLKMHWSADGNSIYFFSRRDDFRCLWARRLNPRSKRPIGNPISLAHFHNARQKIHGFGWVAVSKPWLAINVTDMRSSLFLLER